MYTSDKRKLLEFSSCYKDENRAIGTNEVFITPDNRPFDFLSFQPDMSFYERYVFPRLADEKMELKFFTFYDDLNKNTFWFLHIISRCTYEVEAANVLGALSMVEAANVAVEMYIRETGEKTK